MVVITALFLNADKLFHDLSRIQIKRLRQPQELFNIDALIAAFDIRHEGRWFADLGGYVGRTLAGPLTRLNEDAAKRLILLAVQTFPHMARPHR